VIKVPNEGYKSHFFAGRPQIDVESPNTKKFGKKFHRKKNLGLKKEIEALTTATFFLNPNFFSLMALALCMLQRVRLKKLWGLGLLV
jgi:hypothetical protein